MPVNIAPATKNLKSKHKVEGNPKKIVDHHTFRIRLITMEGKILNQGDLNNQVENVESCVCDECSRDEYLSYKLTQSQSESQSQLETQSSSNLSLIQNQSQSQIQAQLLSNLSLTQNTSQANYCSSSFKPIIIITVI